MDMKAVFWATVAAVAVVGLALTAGAYTGEFGFGGDDGTQVAAEAIQAASPVLDAPASLVDAVDDDVWEDGEGEDWYEEDEDGHEDDDGERDHEEHEDDDEEEDEHEKWDD